jgi:hypothetical protein
MNNADTNARNGYMQLIDLGWLSGAPAFSLFYNAICAPEPKLQFCLIRASKQSLEKILGECG